MESPIRQTLPDTLSQLKNFVLAVLVAAGLWGAEFLIFRALFPRYEGWALLSVILIGGLATTVSLWLAFMLERIIRGRR